MSPRPRPIVLCILDGWGFRDDTPDNAITRAHTPVFDKYWASNPHALLEASEEHVGLPAGQIGNSEVGHNLGDSDIDWERMVDVVAFDRQRTEVDDCMGLEDQEE